MGRPKIPPVSRTCPQCGDEFLIARSRSAQCCSRSCGQKLSYAKGVRNARFGAENNRYNHGLCLYDGRWIVTCSDRTITHYARCVMAAHIGRLLRSDEIVHHINGDPLDDRIENPTVVSRADHAWFHGVLEADARRETMANARS